MAGGSKKTTQTNVVDPSQYGLYTANLRNAQQMAGILSPQGQPVTPGTPAYDATAPGVAGTNAGIAAMSAPGILNFDPGTLASTDLTQYMNPYQKDVIDATIADQERARQIAQVGNDQRATAAGAFGGSRSGILGAETNAAYDRNTGQLIAGLRANNFSQAQSAAQQDIQTKLAAAGFRLNAAGQLVDASGAQVSQAAARQAIANSALGIIPVQQTVTGTEKTNSGLPGILGALGSLAQGAAAFF